MSVTLYSLGDHEIIRAGLNAVAMLFDSRNTELLAGSGALGLGHAAGFGLLVSLGWLAMRVLLGQPFTPGHLIAILLAYVVMFVPKITVQVEDIYSGQVAVVDNVPIGVALPGGLISGVSRSITLKLDQALRISDAETSSLTADGLVSPLKLMLAARGAAIANQALALSLSQYIANCTDGFPPNAIGKVTSPYDFLDSPFSGHLTSLYPTGTAVTNASHWNGMNEEPCERAAVSINDQLTNLLSSPEFDSYLSSRMDGKRPNAAYNGKWAASDLQQFINNFSKSGINAQAMMAQLATFDIISDTYKCGALDEADAISCSAVMRSSVEGYKFDSAGRASLFSRAMIPSMNVFMFLFFAVAPLIAILIVVSGMHGVVKILPNYLLFGVWTQSWLPMSSIVNHFIQRQAKEAAQVGILTSDGLPLQAGIEFYDLLGGKIAAASDLLAATPLVTLALISGSAMALANLATKSGDHLNEKNLAPDVKSTGSVTDTQARRVEAPSITTSGNTLVEGPAGTHAAGAKSGIVNLGYSGEVASSVASKETAALTKSSQQLQELSAAAGSEYGRQVAGGQNLASGTTTSATYKQGHGHAFDFGRNFAQGMKLNLSESEAKSLGFSLNKMGEATSAALVQGAKMGLTGKGLKNFVTGAVKAFAKDALPKIAAKAGAALPSVAMMEQFTTQMDKTLSEQFASSEKQTDTWAAEFSTGKMSKDEKTFSDQSSMGFKSSYSERLASSKSAVQQHGEAAERAKMTQQRASGSTTFDEPRIGQIGASSASYMEWARSTFASDGGTKQQLATMMQKVAKAGFFGGEEQSVQREAVALTASLKAAGRGGEAALRLASAETGVDNMKFMPNAQDVQGSTDSTFSKVAGVGPTQQDQKRIAAGAKKAEGEAGKGRDAGAAAPEAVAGAQGAAATPVTKDDFNQMSGEVDKNAQGSGVGAKNDGHVTSATSSESFQKGSETMKSEFKQNHGFSDLVSKFGQEVMDNPALAAIAATGGAAAAYEALSSIQKNHMTGLGGNKMSVAQYGKKVLERMAGKVPGLVAKAGARAGAATIAGSAGLAVGVTALNAGALALDVADVIGAVRDSMKEVDAETSAATAPPAKGGVPAPAGQSGGATTPASSATGELSTVPAPSSGAAGAGGGDGKPSVTEQATGSGSGGGQAGRDGGSDAVKSSSSAPAGGWPRSADPTPVEAAQRVVDGLSGADPMGYIQQTYSGGTGKGRDAGAAAPEAVAGAQGAAAAPATQGDFNQMSGDVDRNAQGSGVGGVLSGQGGRKR